MPDLFTAHGIKAVLFDFDGTLADTPLDFRLMRQRAAAAVRCLTENKLPEDMPLIEALDLVCAGLDPAEAARLRVAAMRAVVEVEVEAARRGRLFPFTKPLLIALRAQGTPVAIVTRNCPAAVFTSFPDLDQYVSCLLTRDDVSRVKPDPAHVTAGLDCLGVPAGQSLMVGDHPMDIQAGKRAGTRTAGVATGGTPLAPLEREAPDWLADDAGRLMRRLGLDVRW